MVVHIVFQNSDKMSGLMDVVEYETEMSQLYTLLLRGDWSLLILTTNPSGLFQIVDFVWHSIFVYSHRKTK